MDSSRVARIVEKNLFGALLGSLAGAAIARFILLAYDLVPLVLLALLGVGAWSGAFLAHYGSRSSDAVLSTFRTWNSRLRRVSLRAMLWLLGVAAVIGVLTVLTASYDVLGRVAGTVVTTAIAAGLLWPLSILVDRDRGQGAGLLGMASVMLVYMLVIPLIWDLDRNEFQIVATSLIIGLTAPFGMLFLILKHTHPPHGSQLV